MALKERNSIVEIGHRAQRINKLIDSDPQTKDIPQEIKNRILIDATNQDPMPILKEYYNRFMMVDRFPENSQRFNFDKTKIEPG